jgi:sugar/nucleoside kinase (ribokinase family)
MNENNPSLVIVGSIGLDTIETPVDKREDILGGSVSYAAAASSFFSSTGMVGVVGSDFPAACRSLYERFGIDLEGLQTAEGKTFKWHGVYEANMNNRETINTDLNVFADFHPVMPEKYTSAPYLFLANIAPDLQLHVLDQATNLKFVAADTMDLWINIAHEKLLEVISRVDLLTINDSEAWLLTEKHNPVHAARWILDHGPKFVIIKKGEHGAMLVTKDEVFIIPAFPVEQVIDPTGAGDTFAGGLMGTLASLDDASEASIRKGMLHGSVLASFGVEAFSLDNLDSLTQEKIKSRCEALRGMCHIPS